MTLSEARLKKFGPQKSGHVCVDKWFPKSTCPTIYFNMSVDVCVTKSPALQNRLQSILGWLTLSVMMRFTLPDTDRRRDQYKMGCIELCGAVHTAPRQT